MGQFLTTLNKLSDDNKQTESKNRQGQLTYEGIINDLNLEIEKKNARINDLLEGRATVSEKHILSSQWDSTKWANEIQSLKFEIYHLHIKLKLALETYKSLFTEN